VTSWKVIHFLSPSVISLLQSALPSILKNTDFFQFHHNYSIIQVVFSGATQSDLRNSIRWQTRLPTFLLLGVQVSDPNTSVGVNVILGNAFESFLALFAWNFRLLCAKYNITCHQLLKDTDRVPKMFKELPNNNWRNMSQETIDW
jgi:hypothetical protein